MSADVLSYPLQAEGIVTRVFDTFAGERAVLFIHGLGARADRWRHNLPAVAAAGWRGVAVDLPGHGFATKSADFAHGVEGYVRFIAGVIAGLGLERPVLVGTSLGGHVAAALACRSPAQVGGLILVGATGLFPIGEEARRRLASRAADSSLEGIRSKANVVFLDPRHAGAAFVHEEHRINNSPGADAVFEVLGRYLLERLDDDVVGPALATLAPRPPIELVWGTEDRSVPAAIGRAAAELLAPAPLHLIEGAAHAPYFEQPERFNRLLADFLTAREAPSSAPSTRSPA